MNRICLIALFVASITSSFAGVASAALATLTPTQDVFLYQGLPTSNFQSGAFASFNTTLSSGATSTGHDIHTLIQFDLTGVTVDPGETASFNLYSVSSPFGQSPTAGTPVTADLYALTADWDDDAATWNTEPAHGASIVGSATIDGTGKWINFDITAQVQAWIANPSSNHGLLIVQPTIVPPSGPAVAASYSSSEGANVPFVQVPEPTSLALIASGGLLLMRRRRNM
jgi:hypothetical protein